MKKWMLSLALILACMIPMLQAAAENAEPVGAYLTSITNDEGADLYDIYLTGMEDASVSFDADVSDSGMYLIEKTGIASVRLFISKCDLVEAEGVSLADIDEENMERVKALAGQDYDDPQFELLTSPDGNEYLKMTSEEENCLAHIFTIYKGTVIDMVQYREDFSPLTEEDQAFMNSVLYGLDYVEAAR